MSRNKPARRRHWMIAQCENSLTEVLAFVPAGGEETLPVFSFEEEAELFLRCEAPEGGWTVRETMPGELISVLYGPCSGVKTVALDPLPEVLDEGMMNLISLSRTRFLDTLLDRERPSGFTPRSTKIPHHAGSAAHG